VLDNIKKSNTFASRFRAAESKKLVCFSLKQIKQEIVDKNTAKHLVGKKKSCTFATR